MSDKFSSRRFTALFFAALFSALPLSAQVAKPPVSASAPPAPSPAVLKLQAVYQRALKLQSAKKYREAAAEYREYLRQGAALKIPPSAELPAYGGLAFCFAQLRKTTEQLNALSQFVKRDPNNAAAVAQIASIYTNRRQWKLAKETSQKALTLKPNPQISVSALFSLGTSALELNDLPTAVSSFIKAISLSPKNAQLRFNAAVALARSSRFPEALKQAEAARDLAPGLTQPRLLIATLLQGEKRFPESLSAYNALLKKEPNNLLVLFNRAMILQQIGRNDEALDAYLEVTKRYPNNYAAQMNTAQLYLSSQNWAAAKYRFGVVLKLAPNNPAALAGLGRTELEEASKLVDPRLKREGFAKAEDDLKKAVSAEPKNPLFSDQLSVLYERMGRYPEAVAVYQERIRSAPKDRRNYFRVGNLYKQQRNLDGVASTWRAYRVQNPDDETSYREVAETFRLGGRKQEAFNEMEAYLKRKPNAGDALLLTASLLTDLKKPEEAAKRYRRAAERAASGEGETDLKLKPAAIAAERRINLEGWRGLALLAENKGDWKEAIEAWTQAKEVNETAVKKDGVASDPSLSRGLANAYEKDGQPEKAIAEYRMLTLQLPAETLALQEIARIEEGRGRIAEAVSALRQGVERSPSPLQTGLKIPELYLRAKQPQNAVAEYEALRTTNPKETSVLLPLAQAYETARSDEKALAVYNDLLAFDASASWVEGKKAALLVRLKRYPEAKAIYEKTLIKNPEDLQSFSDVSHLYALQGQQPAFLSWLKARLQKTPASAPVMSYLVDESIRQKQEEEGWAVLKHHFELEKSKRNVQEAYALTLQGHQKFPEAIQILQLIASQNPKDLSAQLAFTDGLEQSGQTEASTQKLAALLKSPDYPTSALDVVRRRLAERYVVQKKPEEAISLYQEVFSRNSADLQTAAALTDLLSQTGREREAIPVFLSLLKVEFPAPIRAVVQSKLGGVYEKIGNRTEAEAQYRAALQSNPSDPGALEGLKRIAGK